ncbi:PucR family transcriptional regulator [Amycolatopsis magusensis]|uniref:PucR family transcriptional regulator n=1 Tax=Amycolatopsis magusensis TaxID=882444 RepID=UPI0024A95BA4|nr:helix-turn-helix domain-containing protein [Amycolatopsis magusensis]MDI5978868.1 helix-turn-helix domain-containing protein [Amycolatopsis magusensis]
MSLFAAVSGDYLHGLVDVAATGRRLNSAELEDCRRGGASAASGGDSLGGLINSYTHATMLAWQHLPQLARRRWGRPLTGDAVAEMGSAVFSAMKAAVAAATAGYQRVYQDSGGADRHLREVFIADLLGGNADIASLVRRAERFDLRLISAHVVAVVEAPAPFKMACKAAARAEAALRSGLGARDVLVTVSEGRLLAITPAENAGAGAEAQVGAILAKVVDEEVTGAWRVAVGRPQAGVQGVSRSYRDCRDVLELADRLRLRERVVEAASILLYQVLLRDAEAMTDLVQMVLGSLVEARNGAEPLLETLEGYFAAGCVTAEVARKLHMTERAVTYRLSRIHALTGYDVHSPEHRLALEVAVIGARFFGWPIEEVPGRARSAGE